MENSSSKLNSDDKLEPSGSDKKDPFVFWRRILAFLLDGTLLGIPGGIVGFCFFDAFAQIGPCGRIIGFIAYLLYFGFFNSSLGRGQTIGKRILKIKVVDKKGEFISPGLSAARAAVLALPIMLNFIILPVNVMSQPFIDILLCILLFGLGGAWIYLFLFNRPSRQTLYDLMANTVVIRADLTASSTLAPITLAPIWKGHLIIIAIYSIAMAVIPTIMLTSEMRKPEMQEQIASAIALQDSADLIYCQIMSMTSMMADTSGKSTSSKYLSVLGIARHKPKNSSESINRLAKEVVKQYPKVLQLDGLQVRLSYGFDIGIASGSQGETRNMSRAELEKLVGEK
jgi:uncharacterized RDD family membrane protein YckC